MQISLFYSNVKHLKTQFNNLFVINSRNQTDPGRALLSRYVILLATMLRPEVAVAVAEIHRFKVQRTAVYTEVFQHRARNQAVVHPVVPKHYVSVFLYYKIKHVYILHICMCLNCISA